MQRIASILFICLFCISSEAAIKEEELDPEMLRLMDLLKEWEVLKELELMRELGMVEGFEAAPSGRPRPSREAPKDRR